MTPFVQLAGTTNSIGFDGLGIGPFDVDRVAISIGTGDQPFNIYWYGIIIALGMVLAVIFACSYTKKVGLVPDDVIDASIYCIIPALIGARLFYVLFQLDMYKTESGGLDISKIIFGVRDGGLAIYGGIIVGFLVALLMCRIKCKDPLALFDVGALGFMIGQAVGRWGNFMNAEAYGYKTDLPWGMTINGNGPYHPTFFYESLWNVIGFVLLLILAKYVKKRNGETFLGYFIWYGAGRAVIEGFRTDSLWVFSDATAESLGFNLRISQVLGIVFAVVGIVLLILLRTGKFDNFLSSCKLRREQRASLKAEKKASAEKEKKEAEQKAYNPLFKDTPASEQTLYEEPDLEMYGDIDISDVEMIPCEDIYPIDEEPEPKPAVYEEPDLEMYGDIDISDVEMIPCEDLVDSDIPVGKEKDDE